MIDALMIESCVRGYHYYQDVWEQEPENLHDHYAVTVLKEEIVVGHVLRKILTLCCIFLKKGKYNNWHQELLSWFS